MNWPLVTAWGCQAFQLYLMMRMRNRHRAEVARQKTRYKEADRSVETLSKKLQQAREENASLHRQARQAIQARDRCAEVLARKLRAHNEKS